MASAPLSIKWQHRGNFRRFSVASEEFDKVLQKAKSLEPDFHGKLAWKDTDGDLIALGSTVELKEAIREANGLLRLHSINDDTDIARKIADVTEKQPKATSAAISAQIKAAPVTDSPKNDAEMTEATPEDKSGVHNGISCDGCQKGPIDGIRFKCIVCPNYDLCPECDANATHNQHPMLRISDPNDRSWRWMLLHRRGMGHGPWGPGRHGMPRRVGRCDGNGGTTGEGRPRCGPSTDGPRVRWCRHTAPDSGADAATTDNGEKRQKTQMDLKDLKDLDDLKDLEDLKDLKDLDDLKYLKDLDDLKDLKDLDLKDVADHVAATLAMFGIRGAVGAGFGGKRDEAAPTEADTLRQLAAMGFEDDNGWLTALVHAKHGDINAVLNALHVPRH